jgi:hypothetical protein
VAGPGPGTRHTRRVNCDSICEGDHGPRVATTARSASLPVAGWAAPSPGRAAGGRGLLDPGRATPQPGGPVRRGLAPRPRSPGRSTLARTPWLASADATPEVAVTVTVSVTASGPSSRPPLAVCRGGRKQGPLRPRRPRSGPCRCPAPVGLPALPPEPTCGTKCFGTFGPKCVRMEERAGVLLLKDEEGCDRAGSRPSPHRCAPSS